MKMQNKRKIKSLLEDSGDYMTPGTEPRSILISCLQDKSPTAVALAFVVKI